MNRKPTNKNVFGKNPYAVYHSARITLILVAILTVVNSISYLFPSEDGTFTYMLFSSYISLSSISVFDYVGLELGIPGLIGVGYVVTAVIVAFVMVCFFLSKRKKGFMLAAAIFFSIDTVVLLMDIAYASIIDLIFHAIILVELFSAFFKGMTKEQFEKKLMEEARLNDALYQNGEKIVDEPIVEEPIVNDAPVEEPINSESPVEEAPVEEPPVTETAEAPTSDFVIEEVEITEDIEVTEGTPENV